MKCPLVEGAFLFGTILLTCQDTALIPPTRIAKKEKAQSEESLILCRAQRVEKFGPSRQLLLT